MEWKWIGLVVITYAVNKFLLFVSMYPILIDILPGRYNWEGKIVGSLFIILSGYSLFRGDLASFGIAVLITV